MHADIAQPLHSTQGRFPLILHASPSIVFLRLLFLSSALHNSSTWCRLCCCNLTFWGCWSCCSFSLYGIWAGSRCRLCLQVWHSTFAVYHKNAIKIIIESTYPRTRNRGSVAWPVSCQLTSYVDLQRQFSTQAAVWSLPPPLLLNMSTWVRFLMLDDKCTQPFLRRKMTECVYLDWGRFSIQH